MKEETLKIKLNENGEKLIEKLINDKQLRRIEIKKELKNEKQ